MIDQPIAPGQTLAGKYRIERVLGTGAMGMVLAATNIGLGARVAIKVMHAGGKNGPEQEERFLREARVAAMLRSEHAGKVLDIGATEGGAPYIVMEFLDGQDLASLLKKRGPLPVVEALAYVLQACEAIAEAHGLGIVHRDIKPENLFLTKGVDGAPCVKVVDFGIAKQLDGLGLTQTGATLGSPLFMSPEQMNGSRDLDARTDIWSLGVTLYQLLAQKTPFHADTLMQLCMRVYQAPPTPLEEFRRDVPAGLTAVIMQCLEKDKERRWPNVAAFAAALAPYASARSAHYAERVAGVQGVDVVPSRRTDVLPPEPTPHPAPAMERAAGAQPVEAAPSQTTAMAMGAMSTAGAPVAAPRLVPVLVVIAGLGVLGLLAAASWFGLRGSASTMLSATTAAIQPATTVQVTASPQVTPAGDATASAAPPPSVSASAAPPPSASASAPAPVSSPSPPASRPSVPALRPKPHVDDGDPFRRDRK